MYFNQPQQQSRPFVYIQYPAPSSTKKTIDNHELRTDSSSSSSTTTTNTTTITIEQPKKKKRQHVGYACDNNQALRLDNVSLRQRLGELESKVDWLTSFVTNLEQDYRTTIPKLMSHVQPQEQQQQQQIVNGHSVEEWAIQTGWPVVEHINGMKSIYTNIKSFEDLSEAIKNTMQLIYNLKGAPILCRPSSISTDDDSVTSGSTVSSAKEHSFGFFESLGRLPTHGSKITLRNDDGSISSKMMAQPTISDKHLEVDVMTRLIHQHHKCAFPTLVSPSRFENHYRQGQLKPLVLSSVFSHSVPHTSIYHPHLTQIKDFRELGVKFYNHSHDLLGVDDEPANLSNIHQRTFLITYDLDHGRVRRAFLHIGIAIRMCFMLNLHRPEGYVSCKTPFEREQSKRIFWTVWFYDNMVSQLFHDQVAAMKLSQISIDLPAILPEFNQLERDQTIFTIQLIQIRKLAGSISEDLPRLEPHKLVKKYKCKLRTFYHELPSHLRFGKEANVLPPSTSLWERRTYYCILLDYCQAWITIYRALLPSSSATRTSSLENEAILHTSQAAVAAVKLFQAWFQSSALSSEGFDCFFRPYLYHFLSAKKILCANVAHIGRSPSLVYISRAYLVLLLQLYQTTPTRRSFDESAVENDLLQFLTEHHISMNEVPYQEMVDEALRDDPNADGGWSIFSYVPSPVMDDEDESKSRASSSSTASYGSDHPIIMTELAMDYF
ncbi:hypothetical protein CU097_011829 [Rhizopus azygosporus]|uniref:Xylanolytic transcriptional activator regulatory domain-containing protein n=2 Tax=Rhizopus TaxID=4842 RepID=A0A367JQF0_RHIAZ|nr:hypothetical protein CU097_011829 [Rhizopus azygosporus]